MDCPKLKPNLWILNLCSIINRTKDSNMQKLMLVSEESPESHFTFTMLSSICRSLWSTVTLLYALVYHFEKSSIFLATSTMHLFKISFFSTPTCAVQSRVDILARPKAGSHTHSNSGSKLITRLETLRKYLTQRPWLPLLQIHS